MAESERGTKRIPRDEEVAPPIHMYSEPAEEGCGPILVLGSVCAATSLRLQGEAIGIAPFEFPCSPAKTTSLDHHRLSFPTFHRWNKRKLLQDRKRP